MVATVTHSMATRPLPTRRRPRTDAITYISWTSSSTLAYARDDSRRPCDCSPSPRSRRGSKASSLSPPFVPSTRLAIPNLDTCIVTAPRRKPNPNLSLACVALGLLASSTSIIVAASPIATADRQPGADASWAEARRRPLPDPAPASTSATRRQVGAPASRPARPTQTPPPPSPFSRHPQFVYQREAQQVDGAVRKRSIAPKYEYINGTWQEVPNWYLLGSSGGAGDKNRPTATFDLALENNVEASVTTTSAAARTTPASTSASTSASPSASKQITIPAGWKSTPRETNFYAVPVIVAMSVLVALLVISTVVGSAVWRRKKHHSRRNHPGEVEKGRMGRMMEKAGLGLSWEKRRGAGGGVDGAGKNKSKGKDSDKDKRRRATRTQAQPAPGQDMATAPQDEGVARSISDSGSIQSGSATGRPVGGYRGSIASAHARLRRRRERRAARANAGNDDDGSGSGDDASRPLTGSHAGSVTPNDTLTARLVARLRSNGHLSTSHGTSTVFRDLDRVSSISSGRSGDALSRVSSQNSDLSRAGREEVFAGALPDPVYSAASSRSASIRSNRSRAPPSASAPASQLASFGSAFDTADTLLPTPGPPAYRPAASTIATTTRFSISRIPPPRIQVIEDDDDVWHWPNEKARVAPPSSSSSTVVSSPSSGSRQSQAIDALAVDDDRPELDETPPHDDAVFSAHLATDDKAVLARLRERASRRGGEGESNAAGASSSSSTGVLAAASAPPILHDEDEDEGDGDKGVEYAFGVASASDPPTLGIPAPSAPDEANPLSTDGSSGVLPAPPRPISTSFDYSAASSGGGRRRAAAVDDYDEPELGFLPVYERRPIVDSDSRGEIMARASAPPIVADDNDEEDDLEYVGPAPRIDGRTEHREV